jgi:cytoskeletal protein CcmA (bactofilin family)
MRDLSVTDFDWNTDRGYAQEAASIVDQHSVFDGTFTSSRDLRVDGDLRGSVECEGTLFVTESGRVSATIVTEHFDVAGEVSGEIRCRGRLQILATGRVRATVVTGSLVIQEGAIFEGQLDMAGIERTSLRSIRGKGSSTSAVEPTPIDRSSASSTYIRRLESPETNWEPPTNELNGNDVGPSDGDAKDSAEK